MAVKKKAKKPAKKKRVQKRPAKKKGKARVAKKSKVLKKTAKKKAAKRPAKKVAKKSSRSTAVSKRKKKTAKRKPGRPTKYTKAIAAKICGQLAMGKSMRTVCKDPKLPCPATIFNWLRDIPEFLEQYELAKEEAADALVDEMLDIADDGMNDYYFDTIISKLDPDTTVAELMNDEGYLALRALCAKARPEGAQRSRLRLDARKWIASKLKPKKYGDKITHAGDEDNPVQFEKIERVILDHPKN